MASTNRPLSLLIADAIVWYCVFVLMALILLTSFRAADVGEKRPCDEIYVVGEGETLHSISHKCGDLFIVEHNPHIQDPDDVFPGLVIQITPLLNSRKFFR